MLTQLSALILLVPTMVLAAEVPPLTLTEVGDSVVSASIEIRGVSAAAFNPSHWEANTLNWVRDARSPLLQPLPGVCRNIYAPSAVETTSGWTLFYGAWDGTDTGNDRIYMTTTGDFLEFGPRTRIIEHGEFEHVCNVNALATSDGGYEMICTGLPATSSLNKPVYFTSPDGKTWNGVSAPYPAKLSDIISMDGYPGYPGADINGMNVLLREADQLSLYFGNFKNFNGVYKAKRTTGTTFTLEGRALDQPLAVNDVKKFVVDGKPHYLMGLHMNRQRLQYSLSGDGSHFNETKTLFESSGSDEGYMVALGWVVSGEQEAEGRKLLGVLYGAGALPTLDANRIFARWLQKRIEITPENGTALAFHAWGPDRQIFHAGPAELNADVTCYAEDSVTTIGSCGKVTFRPGRAYALRSR